MSDCYASFEYASLLDVVACIRGCAYIFAVLVRHPLPVSSCRRGADPSIKMDAMDEYLDPGHKLPVEVARKDMRENILELEEKYKVRHGQLSKP